MEITIRNPVSMAEIQKMIPGYSSCAYYDLISGVKKLNDAIVDMSGENLNERIVKNLRAFLNSIILLSEEFVKDPYLKDIPREAKE